MNIFVTSICPARSARQLDDRRVIKMVLETTQLLCGALNIHANKQVAPYKTTHKNHPAAIWARTSRKNWLWLHEHGLALCKEYTARYSKVHKCEGILIEILAQANLIPDGPVTAFANCAANNELGINYKHVEPVTKAYQLYLNDRWDNDKREPTWYKESR